ncbi:MAG TPA: hypothetical protein VJX67_27125 [Blastocatellia bacterium]|nr:hypothetical protein [Blastocatellia bacterium]
MSANPGDQRNWFEKLSGKIPGYGGYVDKERRRDTDKLHREHVADRLRSLKNPLNQTMQELSSGGRLFEVGPIDHLIKKLDKLENRIRFASYGYAGFFDVVKVDQAKLDSIYQADLGLVQGVDQAEANVAQLKSQAGTADGLKTAAAGVDNTLDEIERTFEGRYNTLNNYTETPQPAGPMFGGPGGAS